MTVPAPAASPLPAWQASADLVVVGTGVAGLTAARHAARHGLAVLIVTKGAADDASTRWAQGGVAVVRPAPERDAGDSVAAHVADTLAAAGGLADADAVHLILRHGAAAIDRLIASGARFDAGPAGLLRTREGGHARNRVIHAGGDATGAEIERALLDAPGLPAVLTDHLALDVVLDAAGAAGGLAVLDDAGRIGLIRAPAVMLATGGAGHCYAATTNPAVATGDGLAMALRAGAALADTEFFQFHPTVLWTGSGALGRRPLITEAVRGEGAVLLDARGDLVMRGVHPMADLAPRDVVSLAVSRRMATTGTDHVYLDARGIDAAGFVRRFPTVTAACRAAGIDPTRQPIPVAPAAHYHCGGIVTDLDGRTTVPGLLAVGEVARTGLHGANRLASNSLLEGLVMGERAAGAAARAARRRGDAGPGRAAGAELLLRPPATLDPRARGPLQAAMSATAGIGRDAAGLGATAALARAGSRAAPAVTRDAVEAANLALASGALVAGALAREESRGCHVRLDYPHAADAWRRPVIVRLVDGALTATAEPVALAVAG